MRRRKADWGSGSGAGALLRRGARVEGDAERSGGRCQSAPAAEGASEISPGVKSAPPNPPPSASRNMSLKWGHS